MKTNYWAVLVCADRVLAAWRALVRRAVQQGMDGARTHAGNDGQFGQCQSWIWPFILTFLLNLLIAFVLAQICIWRNANTAARGAAVGVLLWLGIVGPIVYTTYMYEMRSKELFAINEFYPLFGLCLMGAILGAWKKKAA